MSDVWASASGFVQFDPTEREANGKSVVDIVIKTSGPDGKYIRSTIWPEFQVTIKRGDFVAVDGKLTLRSYEDKNGETKNQIQISPVSLAVVPAVPREDTRSVVQKADTSVVVDRTSSQDAAELIF